MSKTDRTMPKPERNNSYVLYGAITGVIAGLVFGLLIQFRLERMTAIGAMYTLGEPSLSAGWVAHVFHSALFGGLFGLVIDREPLRSWGRNPLTNAGQGLAFGVLLWGINIVFLWPLWLNSVGVPNAPELPFLGVMPLLGHVIYGGLTGLLFTLTTGDRGEHTSLFRGGG
ncbi:hypothetical protein [Halostella sp. PRR32]|uniref:hypothetical protein n=1 Tax=Halostella sp. PRR32 TaxID=3098147 RepID=UPI002B1DF07B|nr:hypothetical protein [Halostella sp. PRR32]